MKELFENPIYGLSLGQLIKELESVDPEMVCSIGFTRPHSYRGYYEDLAFHLKENVSVKEMLEMCKKCIGKEFTGYKGGEFVMDYYTDVWISEYGVSNGEKIGRVLMAYMLGKIT